MQAEIVGKAAAEDWDFTLTGRLMTLFLPAKRR
jgi:hypothetical protein